MPESEPTPKKPRDNTRKAGNHHDASYDPQFVYWEFIKAVKLLKGCDFHHDYLLDPDTGEVIAVNPTVHELVNILLNR